jgi:hypothetical protein
MKENITFKEPSKFNDAWDKSDHEAEGKRRKKSKKEEDCISKLKIWEIMEQNTGEETFHWQ